MIQWAQLSEKGNRKINEDALAADVGGGHAFFALADGLGGHGVGEVASALAVQTSMQIGGSTGFSQRLALCMQKANQRILNQQMQTGQTGDMKTTLVLLHVEEKQAQWAHVGDSRLYFFANFRLCARTLDHSVPQMLVQVGDIKEKDIRHHEDRNRLTRVMGVEWDSPRYEVSGVISLTGAAAFLLCTDGFWELIEEKDMIRLLKKSTDPQDWLDKMQCVVEAGGRGKNMDNYSAIAVFVP